MSARIDKQAGSAYPDHILGLGLKCMGFHAWRQQKSDLGLVTGYGTGEIVQGEQ